MGFPLTDLEVPMMKGSKVSSRSIPTKQKEQACIKCGRCVDVCPMELSPLYFVKYADQETGRHERHARNGLRGMSLLPVYLFFQDLDY